MSSAHDRSSWPSVPSIPNIPTLDDSVWQATQALTHQATRVMPREGDEPTAERPEIGRPVGEHTQELFVSCGAGDALVQQFDHLQTEFLTVHDLGTTSSRKLLAGIAAASNRHVQRLVIRRSGAGESLAAIEYVNIPAVNGKAVRLYSSDVDAGPAERAALSRVLLGRARLGLMLVGGLAPHALVASLAEWREAVLGGAWQCRRLLFLPLSASHTMNAAVATFRQQTALDVIATAQVTRPADVWTQLCAHWNRLQQQSHPGRELTSLPLLGTTPSQAPAAPAPRASGFGSFSTAPMPMPTIGQRVTAATPLERYALDLGAMSGVVSVCVFETTTGRWLNHAGARPGPEDLAQHGMALLSSFAAAGRAMGLGAAVPEVSATYGQHHLLLRAVPQHPGIALHLVVDKPHGNLALVQAQLRRLDEALSLAVRAGGL
jgi:hypothetical protein